MKAKLMFVLILSLLLPPRSGECGWTLYEIVERYKQAASEIADVTAKSHYQEASLFLERFAQVESMRSSTGHEISYVKFENSSHSKTYVFVPGKGNSWIEYIPFFQFLYKQGYNIYALDLPGQGFSSQVGKDPFVAHLDELKTYTVSFKDFVDSLINRIPHTKFIGAYSTGAAVAVNYLIDHPNVFERAYLYAPLFKFKFSPLLRPWIANGIIQSFSLVERDKATPFQKDFGYDMISWETLRSFDQMPYKQFRVALSKHFVGVFKGLVSRGWMYHITQLLNRIRSDIHLIKTPFTVFQARRDRHVDNSNQVEMVRRSNGYGRLEVVNENHYLFHNMSNQNRNPILRFHSNENSNSSNSSTPISCVGLLVQSR